MSPARPGARPSVSVCFPAYNEAATVASVLEEAHALLEESGLDYELLVCDDGSTDGSAAVIDALAARLARVRVLRHARNLGIRATFEDLYAAATRDFVFLNSTDRQWDTRVLFELLEHAGDADIVVASRRRKHYTWARALVSACFNLAPRILFGVEVYDAGAVKLVRREIIQRFPIVSRSPFNEAERLVRAARAGYRIRNHPVDTAPRRAGKARGVRWSELHLAVLDVARVWWDLRR